jgi:hypothetical protein
MCEKKETGETQLNHRYAEYRPEDQLGGGMQTRRWAKRAGGTCAVLTALGVLVKRPDALIPLGVLLVLAMLFAWFVLRRRVFLRSSKYQDDNGRQHSETRMWTAGLGSPYDTHTVDQPVEPIHPASTVGMPEAPEATAGPTTEGAAFGTETNDSEHES